MTWSQEFIDALATGQTGYRYILESVDDAPGPTGVGTMKLSSYAEPGYAQVIALGSGVANASGELGVPSWAVGWGSWTVALAGPPMLSGVVTRGTVCRLLVGFPGWSVAQFQPVLLGSLWQLAKSDGQYRLEFREIGTRLGSRGTGVSTDDNGLFYDLSQTQATTISTAYIPGDGTLHVTSTAPFTAPGTVQLKGDDGTLFFLRFTGIGAGTLTGLSTTDIHNTKQTRARIGRAVYLPTAVATNYTAGDATLKVTSTAGLNMRTGTSPYGCVLVTPTTGDPFYLTYTGTAAGPTRLTGVSTTDLFGTVQANAAAGSAVLPVAYDQAHPVRIGRRLLLSTGTSGANGVEDIYPKPWGFAYPPELLDEDDMDWMERHSKPTSGAVTWTMLATAAQDNPLAWLESFLTPGGMFVSTRQGRLTVRAAVNCLTDHTPEHADIFDTDVVTVESYEAWDSTYQIEYTKSRVTTIDGGTTTAETAVSDTWPSVADFALDLPSVTENYSGWRDEVSTRIGDLWTRIPERITLICRGHALARLSRGDTCTLTLGSIILRDGYPASGKEGMILAVQADWFGASTRLVISLRSQFANEFGR